MLALALSTTPAMTFHFFAVLVIVVAAFCIVLWLMRQGKIPASFTYVLYAVMAIVALWFLFSFLGRV